MVHILYLLPVTHSALRRGEQVMLGKEWRKERRGGGVKSWGGGQR